MPLSLTHTCKTEDEAVALAAAVNMPSDPPDPVTAKVEGLDVILTTPVIGGRDLDWHIGHLEAHIGAAKSIVKQFKKDGVPWPPPNL